MPLAAKPTAQTTNPAKASFAALNALGAKRIAVLTPYNSEVNTFVGQGLAEADFEVPVCRSFNEELDPVVAEIETGNIGDALKRLVSRHPVDAAFVSCTSIRMMHAVERFEAELQMPVTSSNHAIAWHCLQFAGYEEKQGGPGQLFRL